MSQDFAVKRQPVFNRLALAIACIAFTCTAAGGWYLISSKSSAPETNAIASPDPASGQPAPGVGDHPADVAVIHPSGADTSLILRLMPRSAVRSVEKLDFGLGTFVWEVDMLVDRDNSATSGFVYLSADGTKLLNGPLMDKRSRVMQKPESAPQPQPSMASAPTAQTPNDSSAVGPAAVPSSAQADPFDPNPGLKAQATKAEYQRKQFYAGISELNYISTTEGSNIVYVLFDPLCHACQRLYKQQSAISAAYDVEFRWIPIFLDARSYPISALIQKTYSESHAKGLEMLDQVLNKQWRAEDHHTEIASLTEGDYEQVKPAGAVFYSIGEASPGMGTPFVTFKNSSGVIEAFGGVPLANDWASLKARQ
ncbi:hypothetical protein SJI00_20900 [Pseudomonas sp. RP23018S]|uniref:hypothetical protein n=1 Tax=Pseudomonas sp. RP23018S TaxID=3096037 RepID=UPI002ACA9ED4|nr:hypothetical protein [Pseudomonas sp. RP23018S]MDZ5605235.1 hypothetical protein [Pseudomonas sp. RP23018S]